MSSSFKKNPDIAMHVAGFQKFLKKTVFPRDCRPFFFDLKAALWLLDNQGQLAICGAPHGEGKTCKSIRLNEIDVPIEYVPECLRECMTRWTEIPIEIGTRPPFVGKFKFKGFLTLSPKGVFLWKKKRKTNPEFPELVDENKINIDEYLERVPLGKPCPNIQRKVIAPPEKKLPTLEEVLNRKPPRFDDIISPEKQDDFCDRMVKDLVAKYSGKRSYKKHGIWVPPLKDDTPSDSSSGE